MRRLLLTLTATASIMAAASLSVIGFGETEVTLSCSDSSTLTFTVDVPTLLGLTEAVQAMLDSPSGLSCGLAQRTLTTMPGLTLTALADSPKDYAVGGGRINNKYYVSNIGFSAHSAADGSGPYNGAVTETVPEGQLLGPGHYNAKITCVKVFGNTANLTARIEHATGFFAAGGDAGCVQDCNWVVLTVQDNGNRVAGISPDMLGGQAVFSLTDPNPTCAITQPMYPMPGLNVVVRDSS
jgi:hypothetical protein